MSPKTDVRRYSPAVPGILLPTNKYPHLKDLVNEVDFVCSTCSSAEGAPVYHTFWEAHKEPLPPNPAGKIGNIVLASGLFFLALGYFTLYKGSDTAAPILIVLGIVTFAIALLIEPDWLPR